VATYALSNPIVAFHQGRLAGIIPSLSSGLLVKVWCIPRGCHMLFVTNSGKGVPVNFSTAHPMRLKATFEYTGVVKGA